jgi:Amt family ammonium transporter
VRKVNKKLMRIGVLSLKLSELPLLVDSLWVFVAAVLVIFMQAGFALLEAGSTRMKNAGHIAAKQ